MTTQTGTLYLVPTPIGNLGDVTLRALDVLRTVDVIACEDTRHSRILLDHFDIRVARVSYHDHNERSRAPQLVARLLAGDSVALISDAGTPGLSDPGFYLTRECIRNDIPVTALPGASALVPAIVASGLPCDRFVFEGFLPARKGRTTRLRALAEEHRTIVLYESVHRIVRTLEDLADVLDADREAAVVRELTKTHEEVVRGTLHEIARELSGRSKLRGEYVIVVGPPQKRKTTS